MSSLPPTYNTAFSTALTEAETTTAALTITVNSCTPYPGSNMVPVTVIDPTTNIPTIYNFDRTSGTHTIQPFPAGSTVRIKVADDDWTNIQIPSGSGSPTAPSNLTIVSKTDKSATIAWVDNSSNEDGFEAIAANVGTGEEKRVLFAANATGGTIDDLTASTSYKVTLRATSEAHGPSAWTLPLFFTTNAVYEPRRINPSGGSFPVFVADDDTTYIDYPTGSVQTFTGQAVGLTVVLTWTVSNPALTTLFLERSFDNTNWTRIATVPQQAGTYTDQNVLPSTLYYYRIAEQTGSPVLFWLYSGPINTNSGGSGGSGDQGLRGRSGSSRSYGSTFTAGSSDTERLLGTEHPKAVIERMTIHIDSGTSSTGYFKLLLGGVSIFEAYANTAEPLAYEVGPLIVPANTALEVEYDTTDVSDSISYSAELRFF